MLLIYNNYDLLLNKRDFMNQDQNKLISLITYAQESAKLKLRSCYDVKKHFFCQFEHEFQDLPGIHFNVESEEGGKWLVIDRLHETKVPDLTDPDLIHWVEISNAPNKNPSLRQSINMGQLQGEKYDISYLEALFKGKSEAVNLKDLKEKNKIESKFRAYLVSLWKPWAVEEKKRRKTINIYSQLFAIKHQLEGNITDAQLELSWGIGIVSWNVAGVKVQHPLITQAVDININDQTMALEIGPRDIDDYLELDFIDLSDNPGAIDLLKFYKDFTNTRTQRVSPFDRESFEAVLQSGVKFLDSKGVYWPSETSVDDRKVPTSSEILKITDTWVLIARPRDKSLFIQDLE
ncbi:MAG: hypothetical protein K1060chlam5_00303, partial [Candidatus Anoxychlamydiales bacterium]|nr:hypothetical protein [Candidatus Anoxychlamydiales bacterium]